MPPMPPPPIGIAGLSSGISLTAASVVMSRPATDAAFWSAVRTTLVGSITPAWTKFSYVSVWALKPIVWSEPSISLPATTDPSWPAFYAIWRIGD